MDPMILYQLIHRTTVTKRKAQAEEISPACTIKKGPLVVMVCYL